LLALLALVRQSFDMADSVEAHAPILAAGGIVLREGSRPRIAIVRLRRDKAWVLPKGKLYPGERPHVAAKREVLEETGHDVSVHEFLGSMAYPVDRKIKIVQFWHMRAIGGPVRELNRDVKAVKWLPLKEAIDMLTRAHEKVFLANVGPVVVKAAKQALRNQSARKAKPAVRSNGKRPARRAPATIIPPAPPPPAPLPVPAVHLISSHNGRTRQNTFVETIGGWIGRMTQSSLRRMG
jgi:8-oxo-dGTP diphosphatase